MVFRVVARTRVKVISFLRTKKIRRFVKNVSLEEERTTAARFIFRGNLSGWLVIYFTRIGYISAVRLHNIKDLFYAFVTASGFTTLGL